jgi:hypothetical protein
MLTLLGVGAMNSPRFRPAGLLIVADGNRVAIDGGSDVLRTARPDTWLVCDEHSELMPQQRRQALMAGLPIGVAACRRPGLTIRPMPVVHTSHPTVGYLISTAGSTVAWAPEFWRFPNWAGGVDLLFADAAGWSRPVRFRGGAGGHAAALDVAEEARDRGVRRLVFAHLGRPTIRAIDAGRRPPFGELGHDGQRFLLPLARDVGAAPSPGRTSRSNGTW